MSRRKRFGFDYRSGASVHKTAQEWREMFDAVIAKGGYQKRIGKDLTAFDHVGKMLFEVYDREETLMRETVP